MTFVDKIIETKSMGGTGNRTRKIGYQIDPNKKFYGQCFDVRDNIIPGGYVDDFRNWLDRNKKIIAQDTSIIEQFYGAALACGNAPVVSVLNLFVRENNIIVDKISILKDIYYANCRLSSNRRPNCCLNFCSFDGAIQEQYENRYLHMFAKKRLHPHPCC